MDVYTCSRIICSLKKQKNILTTFPTSWFNDIFFYVDRMEGGVEEVRKFGLESHALVPLNKHAWDYLQQKGTQMIPK